MPNDFLDPPSKRGTNPRSLANLHPQKAGEPGPNPTGKNGRTRGEYVAKFLDAPADTEIELQLVRKLGLPDDTPRIDVILRREFIASLGRSERGRQGLREQYAGKPRQQMDLSSEDGSMSPIAIDVVFSKTPTEQPPEDEPSEDPIEGVDADKSPKD